MVVDKSRKIFHESWYRIANQRITLRASIRIHRQFYRGVKWYVLYEPFTNQYFRLQENAYEFISRLHLKKTIGQVWQELLEKDPDHSPGQGEIIEILSQLYQANMLHYDIAEDSFQLFDRRSKKQKKKVRSTILNIFFLRIPLLDPDAFLKRIKPLINLVISKPMALIWLIVVGIAGKLAFENFDSLQDQAQGALSPSNLFLLYACGILVKAIHEFGHASVVRRFGGEVHTVGIMFMLLAPLPYVDATAAWSFRSKWQRIFVSSAGMLFEFFIAAIAMIVWANVGGGPVKSVAYNTLFIASVSTLLFNINPLMRFDGYYILTDLLDMPNLQQHSVAHLKYILERFIFRRTDATPVATKVHEAVIYTFYGFASAIYRFFLFAGIIIAISQQYLILAAVMAISLAITMLFIPCGKFIHYIFVNPGLARVRTRAVLLTTVTLGAFLGILFYVPVPDTFTAPGILESTHYENTINRTRGHIIAVKASTGNFVNAGDTLLILENQELENKIQETRAAYEESRLLYYKALAENPENMYPITKRMQVFSQELEQYSIDKKNLTVCAPVSGIWHSPDAANFLGKWLKQGDSLGQIIDTTEFRFVAAISQDDGSRIFSSKNHSFSVRLNGDAFTDIAIESVKAIPTAQNELPSEALGWSGGGDIEVNTAGGNPTQTAEPFYLVQASFKHKEDGVLFLQGRAGKIRFHLGYTPLAKQASRKARQMLQKYYRV